MLCLFQRAPLDEEKRRFGCTSVFCNAWALCHSFWPGQAKQSRMEIRLAHTCLIITHPKRVQACFLWFLQINPLHWVLQFLGLFALEPSPCCSSHSIRRNLFSRAPFPQVIPGGTAGSCKWSLWRLEMEQAEDRAFLWDSLCLHPTPAATLSLSWSLSTCLCSGSHHSASSCAVIAPPLCCSCLTLVWLTPGTDFWWSYFIAFSLLFW